MGLSGLLAVKISNATDYYDLVKKNYASKFSMYHPTDEFRQFPIAQGYFDDTTTAQLWNFDVLIGCGGLKYNSNKMAEMIKTCMFTKNDTIKNKLTYLFTKTAEISAATNIGLGWHNLTMGKNNIIWHNGGSYGFSTFLGMNKDKSVGVFIVANQFNVNEVVDGIGINLINKMSSK